MQKCVKIYKDVGAKIFQKSWVNQPNQGHQPWQSNSLVQVSDMKGILKQLGLLFDDEIDNVL